MAYFAEITDHRRFIGPNGEILAVYDSCRSYTTYAPVGTDESGNVCFVGEPRPYFKDEVEEVR